MTVPFMRAYTELLVATCHKRGAQAIGGMSAFIPDRRDPEVTEKALAQVTADKQREAGQGYDGTWVAHPDLVPVARAVFDEALGDRVDQRHRLRDDVQVTAAQLLDIPSAGGGEPGAVSDAGLRGNISVGVRYLEAWLRGIGAVAIDHLMEDAATAEISRSQVWQWVHQEVVTAEGTRIDADAGRAGAQGGPVRPAPHARATGTTTRSTCSGRSRSPRTSRRSSRCRRTRSSW